MGNNNDACRIAIPDIHWLKDTDAGYGGLLHSMWEPSHADAATCSRSTGSPFWTGSLEARRRSYVWVTHVARSHLRSA